MNPRKISREVRRPRHLWGGRNYLAKRGVPVEDLLALVEGKAPKVPIRDRLRRLWCKVKGHDLVLDRWHKASNPRWLLEKDYEIHIGCRRCPFLLALDPKIYGEGL